MLATERRLRSSRHASPSKSRRTSKHVILGLLEKDPARRPQDAATVRQELLDAGNRDIPSLP
jgi:hypothetical protein